MRRHLLYAQALKEPAFRLIDEKETKEENGRYRVDYTLAPMKTGTHMLSFYEIPLLKQSVLTTPFFVTVTPIKGGKLPPPADQKLRLTPALNPEMRLKVLSMTEGQHYPKRHTLPLKHLMSAALILCIILLVRLTRPSF